MIPSFMTIDVPTRDQKPDKKLVVSFRTDNIINNKGQLIKSLKSNESGNLEYKLPVLQKKTDHRNDLIFFYLLFTNIFIFIYYKKHEK